MIINSAQSAADGGGYGGGGDHCELLKEMGQQAEASQ